MRREEIDRLEKFFFGEDDGIVPRAEGLSRGSSLASPSLTDHWGNWARKDFGFSRSKAHPAGLFPGLLCECAFPPVGTWEVSAQGVPSIR